MHRAIQTKIWTLDPVSVTSNRQVALSGDHSPLETFEVDHPPQIAPWPVISEPRLSDFRTEHAFTGRSGKPLELQRMALFLISQR